MENIKKTKKFIFTSPLQPDSMLKEVTYESKNIESKNNLITRFPIMAVINAYAEENETIEIITVLTEYGNAKINYEKFKEQAKELSETKNFKYNLTEIPTLYDESIGIQKKLYADLITEIGDKEIIYADITYGTKPHAVVKYMALNYAYKNRKKRI